MMKVSRLDYLDQLILQLNDPQGRENAFNALESYVQLENQNIGHNHTFRAQQVEVFECIRDHLLLPWLQSSDQLKIELLIELYALFVSHSLEIELTEAQRSLITGLNQSKSQMVDPQQRLMMELFVMLTEGFGPKALSVRNQFFDWMFRSVSVSQISQIPLVENVAKLLFSSFDEFMVVITPLIHSELTGPELSAYLRWVIYFIETRFPLDYHAVIPLKTSIWQCFSKTLEAKDYATISVLYDLSRLIVKTQGLTSEDVDEFNTHVREPSVLFLENNMMLMESWSDENISRDQDVLCVNANVAYQLALESNQVSVTSACKGTQVCYYLLGTPSEALPNLLHIPLSSLHEFLANNRCRSFTTIVFAGVLVEGAVQKMLREYVLYEASFKLVENEAQLNTIYQKIGNNRLDFRETTFRVWVRAYRYSTVMQYVARSVAAEFESRGHEVMICEEASDLEQLTALWEWESILNFNPHIILNVNYFNNKFPLKEIFNFIWFQDVLDDLNSEKQVHLRERDVLFSLIPDIDYYLEKKSLPFKRQGFCIDTNLYYLDNTVEREDKIVFIGSAYGMDDFEDEPRKSFVEKCVSHMAEGGTFSEETIQQLAAECSLTYEYAKTVLVRTVVRDQMVLWLCEVSSIPVEIYGYGWNRFPQLSTFYKGPLSFGDEVRRVYNSAKYGLVVHPRYVFQQRYFEASACGAIPVVYDCRNHQESTSYDEDATLYFKTKDELKEALRKDIKGSLAKVYSNNTYAHFVTRMIDEVKTRLDDSGQS